MPDQARQVVPEAICGGVDKVGRRARVADHLVNIGALVPGAARVVDRAERLLVVAQALQRHRVLGRASSRPATATMEDESRPPERHVPTGTSARRRRRTASVNRSRY